MSNKELRIALVCYGGLSLAVYMHGVTKELQKLVRASKVYHSPNPDGEAFTYDDANDHHARETDSERVYFDLIRRLAPAAKLRVIIDSIAGTSAGGINGIMLARALAHDLPLDTHRDMWLRSADVTQLMAPLGRGAPIAQLYARPLAWGVSRAARQLNAEAREKLTTLLRARWLRPPFAGDRFLHMLLDALYAMGSTDHERSLLPSNQPLSLQVTLTDFFGYPRKLSLYDPATISEPEHRHVLSFTYVENKAGQRYSELADPFIPALAFAARGTSSYGGVFAPLTIRELNKVLAKRRIEASDAEAYLAHQLGDGTPDSLESRAFIDGGVLNNKPFAAAIRSIRGRTATRQVERRLLYIEPKPIETGPVEKLKTAPGFLATIRQSFALPRNEPIGDELERLEEENRQRRSLRQLAESARPGVRQHVRQVIGDADIDNSEAATVRDWRRRCEQSAIAQAGFTFATYWKLRGERLAQWFASDDPAGRDECADILAGLDTEQFAKLDVVYRLRRIHFLLHRVNELYPVAHSRQRTGALDSLKFALYAARDELKATIPPPPLKEKHRAEDLERIASMLDLSSIDAILDGICSGQNNRQAGDTLRHEILYAHVGFPFFDVLSVIGAPEFNFEELDEVKVVRMSPSDANTLRPGGASSTLKGIELNNFGAFFSRAYRENDYLWGRLHAAERLVDLLISAAGDESLVNANEFKRAVFTAILTAEEPHLSEIEEERERIRRAIDEVQ
ncbi:MAG: patatin-like protein [Pseudomonadota bacterium]